MRLFSIFGLDKAGLAVAVLAFAMMPALAQQQAPAAPAESGQTSTQQQDPAATQSPTESPDPSAAAPATTQDQGQTGQNSGKAGPLGRLKRHVRNQISSGCVNGLGTHCWDKPPKEQEQPQAQAKNAPPRSDNGESSSKATKIDLSPPPGESAPPGVGSNGEVSDVQEFKPWDPHKADKNVEVGDFYFKRNNYRAAASRYQEALYWYDRDAIAFFRLGQCQEKLGDFADAVKSYQGYLKILPDGELAREAKDGLERAKQKAGGPVASVK
jgi:tetratricopeptide (TPR) repeat protein